MRDDMGRVEIQEVAYHRNGICGAGFHAIRFRWRPADSRAPEGFLATLFDEPGHCAVVSLDRIEEHGVSFGKNSWRGDNFERLLRAAVTPTDETTTAEGA